LTRALALDTSSWWGGVALVSRDSDTGETRVEAEMGARVRDSHAEHLLCWVDRLLDAAGWTRSDVAGYVAVRGPGSFTGIRVGLGTVRGLALASGRAAVGVTALEALAEAAGPVECDRLSLVDAGRGELYGCRFDGASSPPSAREESWVRDAGEAVESGRGCVLIPGPGTRLDDHPLPSGVRLMRPPRTLAAAAGCLVLERGFGDAGVQATLAPLYIRPPDAWLKRRPG